MGRCVILPLMVTDIRNLVRRSLLVTSVLDEEALLNAAHCLADSIVLDIACRVPKPLRDNARRSIPILLDDLSTSRAELLLWTDAEGIEADLGGCAPASFGGVLVTVDDPSEVRVIDTVLSSWEQIHSMPDHTLNVELVIASARGVNNADILAKTSRRNVAMALDETMLLREQGLSTSDNPGKLHYHKGKVAMAASSAGLQVHALENTGGAFKERAIAARHAGVRGLFCFNATDVAAINSGFHVSFREVQKAQRVLKTMDEAIDKGRGAVAVSTGQMADLANIRGAQELIAWNDAVKNREADVSNSTATSSS